MPGKQTAFRLGDEILSKLDYLAEEWQTNRTDALKRVISETYDRYTNSEENAAGDTSSYIRNTATLSLHEEALEAWKGRVTDLQSERDTLKAQLSVKDGQIADLNRKLDAADAENRINVETLRGALQAAQTLDAMSKAPALESSDKEPTETKTYQIETAGHVPTFWEYMKMRRNRRKG